MLWNLLFWIFNRVACARGRHEFRLGRSSGAGPYCAVCYIGLNWDGSVR